MQLRTIVSAACLLAVMSIGSALRADDTPGALLKKQIEQKKKMGDLEQERNKVTGPLQNQMFATNAQMGLLQRPPTEQQIADMKTQVTQLKSQLESLEAQLAVVDIKDDAAKQAKIKELQDKSTELSKKMNDAGMPFATKSRDMEREFAPVNVAFSQALAKLVHDPKDGPAAGLKRHREFTWQSNFVGSVQWADEANKDVLSLSVWLEAERVGKPAPGQKLIDDKYPYYPGGGTFFSTRVGNFQVQLNIYNKPELGGDEAKLIGIIKQLIDLDGLDAIKPE